MKLRISILSKSLFVVLLLLVTCNIVKAQVGTLFNSDRQLSSSFVHQVYQDQLGAIWVATDNGLDMYDGYRFRVFNASNGLPSANVNCVAQGKDKSMYVGTTAGLCYWNVNKFEIVVSDDDNRQIVPFVSSMTTSAKGDVYVSTSGWGIWKIIGKGKAKQVFTDVRGIAHGRSMCFDKSGCLWVVTDNNGVFALRENHGTKGASFVKNYIPKESGAFSVCCVDGNDNVFVGYGNGGLYRVGKDRKVFEAIAPAANLPVISLARRNDGRMYVGTDGYGLKIYDILTNQITEDKIHSNEITLSKTKVGSIFVDREQNLWLGLMQKGVFMQPPLSRTFNYLGYRMGSESPIGESCVMSIMKSHDGLLWVATDHDGIYALKNNTELVRHYAPGAPGNIPSTVLAMTEDNDGRIWVGSFIDGFGWIDPKKGTYHRAAFTYGRSQSVFDLRTDYLGRIWIGTLGDGLKCYDVKNDKLLEYNTETAKSPLCNNFIIQMEMSTDKRLLFVGTAAGLCCVDIPSGKWDKVFEDTVLFRSEYINGLCYHPQKGLWVGTRNGLRHVNIKTHEVKYFTTKEGLPSDNISAVEYDDSGNLWVSTYNGICRINPDNNDVNCYFFSDGLQGNEFSDGASFRGSDGELYFGGVSGLTYFNPASIKTLDRKFNVTLMSIAIGNVMVEPKMKSGNYEVCDGYISESSHFDFSHQDNDITLNFSTLLFHGRERIRYSYSINGDDWITLPAGQSDVTISHMPPGDYNFRVIAIDNNVKSPVKEFTVVIHNPWYFTPVARFIYIMLLIAAICWYVYTQRKRTQERLELQDHIHAEELNDQKIRFFINMSHEIRTPMTLIISPLQQLLNEDKDPVRHSRYATMRRNAERILHLVNQIMDIRKIDKGQMEVQMRETNIVDLLQEIVDTFQPTATSKQINLSFLHATDNLPVWVDRSHFDKIMMNVMSNAFKYTPNGGEVRIILSSNATMMNLVVFDNGEKIPEANLESIFQRFNQSKSISNQHKTGTGVGLDLTRSLVQLHHGEIIARNVAEGVEFVITMPLGKEHLKPEEIANWTEEEERLVAEAHAQPIISLADPRADAEEEEGNVVAVAQSKRPTVAVVEDDDEIRNYLLAELSVNYRVVTYSDGEDALKGILREVPQLVITDVMMPHMDGTVLCSKIKSNVNTNHVPVILLTAKSSDEDRLEGLETGADLYVTKPFNMDILRRNVANLLGSRRIMENKYSGNEDQKGKIDEVELESVDEKLLNRIMAVINENINNSDLNIEMICSEVGISRVHLHRKMKELTNQTPHDFIRNLRLKQAARLLSRKGQNVTEVMYRCGFNSATSFSTMFKKMYGVSPRQYQKDHER